MSKKKKQDAAVTVVLQFFAPPDGGEPNACIASVAKDGLAPRLYTPDVTETLYEGVVFELYNDYLRHVAHGQVQAAVKEEKTKKNPVKPTPEVKEEEPAEIADDFDFYAGEEW